MTINYPSRDKTKRRRWGLIGPKWGRLGFAAQIAYTLIGFANSTLGSPKPVPVQNPKTNMRI